MAEHELARSQFEGGPDWLAFRIPCCGRTVNISGLWEHTQDNGDMKFGAECPKCGKEYKIDAAGEADWTPHFVTLIDIEDADE